MPRKKKPTPAEPATSPVPPSPAQPAEPPADDPRLRQNEAGAEHNLEEKEAAAKRLKAIEQTREMPSSEESPPEEDKD